MRIWTRSLRFYRILVAVVLLLGHASAIAAAAVPVCSRAHDGAIQSVSGALAGHDTSTDHGAVAIESTIPVPHDHGPDTPVAPGATACGLVMLAGVGPECAAAAIARVTSTLPWDLAPPSSQFPPPPYQPPRA